MLTNGCKGPNLEAETSGKLFIHTPVYLWSTSDVPGTLRE